MLGNGAVSLILPRSAALATTPAKAAPAVIRRSLVPAAAPARSGSSVNRARKALIAVNRVSSGGAAGPPGTTGAPAAVGVVATIRTMASAEMSGPAAGGGAGVTRTSVVATPPAAQSGLGVAPLAGLTASICSLSTCGPVTGLLRISAT